MKLAFCILVAALAMAVTACNKDDDPLPSGDIETEEPAGGGGGGGSARPRYRQAVKLSGDFKTEDPNPKNLLKMDFNIASDTKNVVFVQLKRKGSVLTPKEKDLIKGIKGKGFLKDFKYALKNQPPMLTGNARKSVDPRGNEDPNTIVLNACTYYLPEFQYCLSADVVESGSRVINAELTLTYIRDERKSVTLFFDAERDQ